MQTIQIDGTFTFADNIRGLKIGDPIKLSHNTNNRINSDAIGAYTLSGKKIGYVPFKSSQINLKAKYKVEKINLSLHNPILLISREVEDSNIIEIEPTFLKKLKYSSNEKIKCPYNNDLKDFLLHLQKKGNNIVDIGITYCDDNYINLFIENEDEKTFYYTITKKYYEENIFKYDDFYKLELCPRCLFAPFMMHRLEVYIELKYKSIDKLLKKKALKTFELDNIEKYSTRIELSKQNSNCNNLELFSLIIKHQISNNNYLADYLKFNINKNIIDYDIKELKEHYNELKVGGLCYNHKLKYYCLVDLYDDKNIIELDYELDDNIDNKMIIYLILKLIISNKRQISLYNPIKCTIQQFIFPETIIQLVTSLL